MEGQVFIIWKNNFILNRFSCEGNVMEEVMKCKHVINIILCYKFYVIFRQRILYGFNYFEMSKVLKIMLLLLIIYIYAE